MFLEDKPMSNSDELKEDLDKAQSRLDRLIEEMKLSQSKLEELVEHIKADGEQSAAGEPEEKESS
jgi:hypothetical protein